MSLVLLLLGDWASPSPAGGGEGTSSGFWAPGQRLQAQPGAVCWDICTEQTRGSRNYSQTPSPSVPLIKIWFVFASLSVCQPWNVCWIYSDSRLASGDWWSAAESLISLIHQAAKQNQSFWPLKWDFFFSPTSFSSFHEKKFFFWNWKKMRDGVDSKPMT